MLTVLRHAASDAIVVTHTHSVPVCVFRVNGTYAVLVPYNRANVLGCSLAMQSTPIQFCQFAHPTSTHPLSQHPRQNPTFAHAQHEEDRPNTWRLHSLPIMQHFQPIHTTASTALSNTAVTSRPVGAGSVSSRQMASRHSRRKGARVRDEDGEADDDDDDGDESGRSSSSSAAGSPHFLLAEWLIVRGMSDASLSHFLADVASMDPLDSRQLCLMEEAVRVTEREEKKESRGSDATARLISVCSVYSCDAMGDWLRGLSAVAGDVRRDAARGLVKMEGEDGAMTADDWSDCARALRDKAEAYYVNTAHL